MHPLPDLSGRTVVVTGTTSGLGKSLSAALAGAGARVLMTARDAGRGTAAVEQVRAGLTPSSPGAGSAELVLLDLADLASVRAAATRIREHTGDRLDVLVNNAGVAMGPRAETADGFELQIGTNHLGPAALTWLLMPALRGAGDAEQPSRVVTTSSLGHRSGRIDPDDLHWTRRRYGPNAAYCASKLANLLFAAELDRRLRLAGDPVLSVAAHPGMTESSLLANSFRRAGSGPWKDRVYGVLDRLIVQPVEDGIAPQLAAATGPVHGGDYIGPSGWGEVHGPPAPARRTAAAQDPVLAGRLWQVTAAATGITPDPGRRVQV
ncbi:MULTISPECIES: SDR family NAD(P)-dependent oxidoreductase [unclassified Pseudonocardia]|uniref:SDR family NAD(P)-dependent oxidoreductase n=1 Tax=unclassified Pseudonocardia TaxID=2619320 RepID=UPI0001FFE88C|nr:MULTISPECIES: SDR family NAD(P)-dependent oxidoreductase [unclassified Pseudonocardia]ALE72950.1 protochlorophyllide oxidoreductase [Pseudonocardia sp. EC080625-04]ALL76275.1 protochlorophyllide oxidoreductase [Pseudonocardia sp. EC080610-09]ALL83302.1 protochlorophyllide oxidoreductase [Pseudonocardia sp. EC080619-01]OLM19494.1 putative short chain dehydrogenase [Pseudonocardia sp. Ae707_Ps1]